MTDTELINAIQNGDMTAFDELMRRYQASVWRVAYGYLHNFHDAEDITQEVFIRVFRSLDSYIEKGSIINWLFTITKNIFMDYKARSRHYKFVEFDLFSLKSEESIIDYIQNRQTSERIYGYISRLSLKEQKPLMLEINGYSQSEGAKILGISKASYSHYLHDAKRDMQRMVDVKSL